MTIVHVTLTEVARGDEALKLRVKRLIAKLGMQDINEKRYARYGVLTGVIDEGKLDQIREIPAVAAVECDQERRAY